MQYRSCHLRLRMSNVTSRAMPSNALTSRNRLDGDVAVAVSFCVVARGASRRITRFVRGMAMVLSNDTIVLFFCLPSIKRPIWILRGKAILGVQYAYWTFMKSSMHIGHFIMSSLHTGLDEIQYANWMSSMHMGPVFKWGPTYTYIHIYENEERD